MDEFIQTFHVDWKLLVAQLINFSVVLFVVWRFALKPLMKTMADRSQKIEKSLEDAKRIERELTGAEKTREEKLLQARKDAQDIIDGAAKEAERIKSEKIDETKREAADVVEKAKMQIASEKEKMVAEARKEVGGLVIAATEKIVRKKLDDKADHALVEEVVTSMK
ncbi:MAG: ATP synthase F0 subunit B [Candidatus Kerfeldbacteria bacterium RIFCSPLOWO2_01_FULL_48_11]|uniref:ATP synthase subunit b n=1 Tax=Candidatus Kerfeldbacteria bacterium RIFCSPLOWO2_01_FULL_48_11 TaxID=1798543 RepID=A0A1G2B164_9BACT|nr:MAG: ATP synthase subunit b [Parcubacteria group bacterium GW2011_GWA2_48_9]KKW15641.1 MAG: ATP synthase subunit b [Parcubacteria group bacterium GW2011_GWC2_49_9]OGY82922.1 MAG: ATP synthase F0 subunit B [Candidatus Kerfeldbacteria bacterium RIFCSPLOWO2_01_FULL_48_11]HCM67722.1 ATP synthase F0 subunit B [Candidatus Kerfeldbacteria bacterium]